MATQDDSLSGQIQQARKSGYSDDEITSYLGKNHADLAPKIKQATDSGYKSAEILQYLEGGNKTSLGSGMTDKLNQAAGVPPGKGLTGKEGNAYSDASVIERVKGGVKKAAREVSNLTNVAGLGFPKKLAPQLYGTIEKKTTPSNPEQEEGGKIAEFGSYFIPIPGVSKIEAAVNASRKIKALYGASRGAIELATRTAAQTGNVSDIPGSAALGAATGGTLGAVAGGKVGPILKSKLGAIEKSAIEEAEKRGIPISTGQRTGSKAAQVIEQKMQYIPGSAGPSQKFFDSQKEAGAEAFSKLPKESAAHVHGPSARVPGGVNATPIVTDATGAGKAVVDRVKGDRMADLKAFADRNYDSIRKQLQRHKEVTQPRQFAQAEVQYRKELEDYQSQVAKLDEAGKANGKPLTIEQIQQNPELQKAISAKAPVPPRQPEFAAEVDMRPIRTGLKPLRDELSSNLTETQKASSPGWAALNKIVEGKEDAMDAMALDRDLSTLKGFLRRNKGSYLSDTSQRYASRTVGAMEAQLERSLNEVSPSLMNKLRMARSAVKELHRNDELISKLVPPGMSPIEAFRKLTVTGGSQLPDIQEIKRIAPNALKLVGQTYLQGLAETATSEGGLGRTASILNKWKGLDPRIKREIFGTQTTQGLDRFLLAAKKLNLDLNPSGTAKWKAISHYGEVAAAIGTLLTGHPAALALGASAMTGMNRLAKLMLTPKGSELLTKAITLPVGTRAQERILVSLEAMGEEKYKSSGIPPSVQTSTPPSKAEAADKSLPPK